MIPLGFYDDSRARSLGLEKIDKPTGFNAPEGYRLVAGAGMMQKETYLRGLENEEDFALYAMSDAWFKMPLTRWP